MLVDIKSEFYQRAIEAAIAGDRHYQWGRVLKKITFASGKTVTPGETIGCRVSPNKKNYALVLNPLELDTVTVIPLTQKNRQTLVKNVKWESLIENYSQEIGRVVETQIEFTYDLPSLVTFLFSKNSDFLELKDLIKTKTSVNEVNFFILFNGPGNSLIDYKKFSSALEWFDHPDSSTEIDLKQISRQCFKTKPGNYSLYRWTNLRVKEKLEEGYQFKINTARKDILQSWSRNPKSIGAFSGKNKYLIRSVIPAHRCLNSDVLFRTVMKDIENKKISAEDVLKIYKYVRGVIINNAGPKVDAYLSAPSYTPSSKNTATWNKDAFDFIKRYKIPPVYGILIYKCLRDVCYFASKCLQNDNEKEVVVDVQDNPTFDCYVIRHNKY